MNIKNELSKILWGLFLALMATSYYQYYSDKAMSDTNSNATTIAQELQPTVIDHKTNTDVLPYTPIPEHIDKTHQEVISTNDADNNEATRSVVAKEDNGISYLAGEKIYTDDIILGNKDAQTVIVEYFAFTCHHCAHFAANTFPAIQKHYIDTGKIAYIKRSLVSTAQDSAAASLIYCVSNERRSTFTNVLLRQQENWAFKKDYLDILKNLATLGGVASEVYNTCLEDDKLKTIFMRNTKAIATQPNFKGTPAFSINGTLYNGAIKDLEAHIGQLVK